MVDGAGLDVEADAEGVTLAAIDERADTATESGGGTTAELGATGGLGAIREREATAELEATDGPELITADDEARVPGAPAPWTDDVHDVTPTSAAPTARRISDLWM